MRSIGSDPLYFAVLRMDRKNTPKSVQEFISWFLAHQQQVPRIKFQMAITLKSNNFLIGNCGVRMDNVDAVEAEIGYELDPKYWNHGYATEAAQAIVDFGFSRFRVHRIWAHCVAENVGSAHVLQKLGLKLEGRLPREGVLQRQVVGYADLRHYCTNEWELHKQTHPPAWKQIEE